MQETEQRRKVENIIVVEYFILDSKCVYSRYILDRVVSVDEKIQNFDKLQESL